MFSNFFIYLCFFVFFLACARKLIIGTINFLLFFLSVLFLFFRVFFQHIPFEKFLSPLFFISPLRVLNHIHLVASSLKRNFRFFLTCFFTNISLRIRTEVEEEEVLFVKHQSKRRCTIVQPSRKRAIFANQKSYMEVKYLKLKRFRLLILLEGTCRTELKVEI